MDYDLDDLKDYGKIFEQDSIHILFEDKNGIKIVSQTIHRTPPFTQYLLLNKNSNEISRHFVLTKSIEDYFKVLSGELSSKSDMSTVCGFRQDDFYDKPYKEYEEWYKDNCEKCIYESDMCMYGEEPNEEV